MLFFLKHDHNGSLTYYCKVRVTPNLNEVVILTKPRSFPETNQVYFVPKPDQTLTG